jgi:hypothetical protein
VDRDTVDAAWRRAQPGVKRHANVRVEPGGTYSWSDTPVTPEPPRLTPVEALDRILRGRLPSGFKADLGDLVRAALRERDTLEQQARATYEGAREARAALERQIRIDAARALAEMAMEVEELAGSGAAADVFVDRVRAQAKLFNLMPVGRAGDELPYDPIRHTPIGGHPTDGSMVVVIRPGYTWRVGERDLLLEKAQVAPLVHPGG